MSFRALRKVLKQKELAEAKELEAELLEAEEEEKEAQVARKQNLFALLNESETETESESESDSSNSNDIIGNTLVSSPPKISSASTGNRKKQVNSAATTTKASNRKGNRHTAEAGEDDDFDLLLAEFNQSRPDTEQTAAFSAGEVDSDSLSNALKLNPEWLDANVELKRKFGGSVVGSGGNSAMTQVNSRLLRANPRLANALKRKPFKRKHGFITPRPLWPPFGPAETGLSVKQLPAGEESFSALQVYEIVEEDSYKELIQELLVMVQTGDLEFLMQLVQSCPLFVDGLLLLSDAYRMQSTGDTGEIVERAVYILERILPAEADFLQGTVRFPYSLAGNRKLHLSLFRLCQFVIKQGCWRVALQIAKALLQLDPANDPLCARLFIEFLALQSGEELLGEFDLLYEELKQNCVVPLLPSWPFSRALRMFLEEETNKSDHSVSLDALKDAIRKSPITAKLLADHLKVSLPATFPEDAQRDSFAVAASTVFVARCGMLWKPSEVTSWFRSALSNTFGRSESDHDHSLTVSLITTYPLGSQAPLYRHVLLSDLPGLNVAFPRELSMHLNSFDPCPPEFFEDSSGNGVIRELISRIGSMFR